MGTHYVYAPKDPRDSPARPFYVGKGTGTRAHDHLVRPDDSRKGARIREITDSGSQVLVSVMVDALMERDAIRIEAELIAAFGTVETGGILLNSVVPTGIAKPRVRGAILPHGVLERAQTGLELLKGAVLEFVQANADGVTNAQVASHLGLRSDYGGGSKDYLSYSVLGVLLREGRVIRRPGSRRHVAGGIGSNS